MALEAVRGIHRKDSIIGTLELHHNIIFSALEQLEELLMALLVLFFSFLKSLGLLVSYSLFLGGCPILIRCGCDRSVITLSWLALRFHH